MGWISRCWRGTHETLRHEAFNDLGCRSRWAVGMCGAHRALHDKHQLCEIEESKGKRCKEKIKKPDKGTAMAISCKRLLKQSYQNIPKWNQCKQYQTIIFFILSIRLFIVFSRSSAEDGTLILPLGVIREKIRMQVRSSHSNEVCPGSVEYLGSLWTAMAKGWFQKKSKIFEAPFPLPKALPFFKEDMREPKSTLRRSGEHCLQELWDAEFKWKWSWNFLFSNNVFQMQLRAKHVLAKLLRC